MENDTSRVEFLQNALNAVNALSGKRKQYAQEQQRFRISERNYDALKKKIEVEKEAAVRTQRMTLETGYEKMLREAEEKIADAEKRRGNARTKAMNDRIRMKTAEPRAKNTEHRSEIRSILKENGMPQFCGTEIYMCLFSPSGVTDVLKMVLFFLIALVGIPVLVTLFIRAVWLKILVFVLIDAAFIALYFIIYSRTVAKKPRALGECREIIGKIRANKKEITGITRNIVRDPDDSCYNLNAFDAELTKLNQEKNDIVVKKQEAQAEFETSAAAKIRAEIETAGAEELEKARREFTESSEATRKLAEAISEEEKVLNETYLSRIGEENMTPEGIAKLLEEEKTMQRTDPEGPGPETKG